MDVDVLTVVGPFSGDHGMAEYARHFRSELAASETPCRFHDMDLRALADHQRVPTTDLHRSRGPVLFLLNPPEFLPLARQLGPAFFQDRPTAGLWWWEAPTFPEQWKVAAQLLDEVWAATDYIRDHLVQAIGRAERLPLPASVVAPRAALSPASAGTRFLVTFDYRSTVERKNPEGALRAYVRAFPEPRPDVSLTIKTQAADRVPFEARRLHRLARGRPDVTFIDRDMSRAELDALLEGATCYVSLHRAEGLGLGMLEALRAGRPVIATGFSGNLEFMPADYPLLVAWRWTEIRKGTPLYGPLGGEWAEPDLDHAARLMRDIVDQPGLSRQAVEIGLAHLSTLASTEGLSTFIRARLADLERSPHPRPPPDHPIWTPDSKARGMAVAMARLEPPLRRVPWLHKFAMDLFFGRYDPRPRRTQRPPPGRS